jgi:quercetin dioxygenase-like cupin family protein
LWLPLLVVAQAQKKAGPSGGIVMKTPSELKWVDIPDTKGAQQAVVYGDPQKGANGSFAKFPAGTQIPLHTHTASGRSVVISGTMMEAAEGQKPKELGPGSYFYLPGGMKHTTACKAGADCVIYSHWSGAFDMKPVTP